MAEKAAHLTTTIHPKPSLFEIIAHESLNSTVHPALQKIVQVRYYLYFKNTYILSEPLSRILYRFNSAKI